jgi:hypothetical protein
MNKSTVYFIVALSLVSLGLTLVPNAFSQTQTQNVKILSYSYYVDSVGYLDVVGEVQNVGPNTISSVTLTGSIYSPGGVDQCDSYTQVWALNLLPQQKAPFYMEFYQPNNSPDGTWYSVDVSGVSLQVAQANATSSYNYPDLKIASQNGYVDTTTANKGAYWATGTVQNTGSQTAQNITVIGTFYNSSGSVVAVGFSDTLTPTSLAPGGTASFQVGAFDLNQTGISSSEKITSYSVLIQVLEPILTGAPIISTSSSPSSSSSSPSTSSSTSPSSSSSPPQKNVNSNGSSNSAALYGVVIVIIIIVIAGTILAFKRKPHETVKEKKKARKSMN